jgi:hypothetical protein
VDALLLEGESLADEEVLAALERLVRRGRILERYIRSVRYYVLDTHLGFRPPR